MDVVLPINLPEPVFVGFFPKITRPGSEWLGNPAAREIASVSACISEGPPGWIDHWKHNRHGFYDAEKLAEQVAGPDRAGYDLYAYRLFPFRCIGDKIESAPVDGVGRAPEDYAFLGYDVVTRSTADFFECSPLSCNAAARHYPVNEFCLLAGRETALHVLQEISRDGGYEPGPYYLFEVYRKEGIRESRIRDEDSGNQDSGNQDSQSLIP
jgi:hypothetical protein